MRREGMMKERRDFTDLEVWKKGKELRQYVYELSKTFPKDEKYRLTDQILRSTRSVTANIAGGMGDFITKKVYNT